MIINMQIIYELGLAKEYVQILDNDLKNIQQVTIPIMKKIKLKKI